MGYFSIKMRELPLSHLNKIWLWRRKAFVVKLSFIVAFLLNKSTLSPTSVPQQPLQQFIENVMIRKKNFNWEKWRIFGRTFAFRRIIFSYHTWGKDREKAGSAFQPQKYVESLISKPSSPWKPSKQGKTFFWLRQMTFTVDFLSVGFIWELFLFQTTKANEG